MRQTKVDGGGEARAGMGWWKLSGWAVAGLGAWLASCGPEGNVPERADAGAELGEVQSALTVEQWPAEGVVVTNSAFLEERARLTADIVVTKASSSTLSSNAELVVGMDAVLTGHAKADTLIVRDRALITGTARYNSVQNTGSIAGGGSSPLSLPVPVTIPALPTITQGTQTVSVPASQSQTLAPGNYGTVTLNSGNGGIATKLTLSGALYQIADLVILNDARLECSAACEVRVKNRVIIGQRSYFGPKSGVTGLGAGNVQLIVGGSNGASGPNGSPPATLVDNDAELQAYAFVPNGTIRLGQRVRFSGKILAKDAHFGLDAEGQSLQLPLITQGPQSLTVAQGSPATFSVTASGSGLSYQWQRDGVNISGATGTSHTLPAASPSDNGKQFRVVVRNAAGSVTSAAATLTDELRGKRRDVRRRERRL